MLRSVLLFYRKLWGNLVNEDFEVNLYDPCITNKINILIPRPALAGANVSGRPPRP